MEFLFKDEHGIFCFIGYHTRCHFNELPNTNLDELIHLDDAEVLYHYISKENGDTFPVYYERNGVFITFSDESYIYQYSEYYIKDYTLINLNLLEDEDNI